MAKRKTSKVVDLTTPPVNISKEELDHLQAVVREADAMYINIGRLETQKHQVMHQVDKHNEKIREIQKDLEGKYGQVDIDIRDGKITYPDVKINS